MASSTATSVAVTRSRPPLDVISSAPTRRVTSPSATSTARRAASVSGLIGGHVTEITPPPGPLPGAERGKLCTLRAGDSQEPGEGFSCCAHAGETVLAATGRQDRLAARDRVVRPKGLLEVARHDIGVD